VKTPFFNIILQFIAVILLILTGCEKKFDEYYNVPEDLIGTIIQVLEEDGNYSTFIKAVELVEYDDILGKTGNFTVFAPDDNAFQEYFTESGYTSLESIPDEELRALVFYHIVFWAYSKFKLLYGLGVEDVTIEYETDNFRKETRYKPPMTIEYDQLNRDYTVFHEYKYIPVFSDEYFEDQELSGAYDYNFFYPNTSYSGFHADRAEIIEYDVAAQNGWIHKVNKVLVPPDNHEQILKKNEDFSQFYSLIDERRYYQFNLNYTTQQPNEGDIDDDGIIDSLFLKKNNLFPSTYSLDMEDIGGNGEAILLTVFAPTNDALQRFLTQRTRGYNTLEEIDGYWMDWYLRHYFGLNYWPSELSAMTEDWLWDLTTTLEDGNIEESEVIYKKMASNGPFYGIDKYLLPKVFETAAQPIFGDSEYEWFCELIVHYMVDILINNEDISFTIFAPNNEAMTADGYAARDGLGGFGLYSRQDPLEPIPRNRATDIIKSHVVFGELDEADFEEGTFIKTIQNTYIAVGDDGIYGGENTEPAKVGISLSGGTNGIVYPIDKMLLSPGRNILNTLTDQVNFPQFQEFFKLLFEAGLILFDQDGNYTAMDNISTGVDYTCFIPGNSTIINAKGLGLIPDDTEELRQFLRYHFIEGVIFDDGRSSGVFNTTRYENEEENIFSEIEIINEKYKLQVLDNQGNTRTVTTPNLMATDGVIHIIDELLFYE
jgi:uncharacterized surface protein with fasciclin (FAS1) repeats